MRACRCTRCTTLEANQLLAQSIKRHKTQQRCVLVFLIFGRRLFHSRCRAATERKDKERSESGKFPAQTLPKTKYKTTKTKEEENKTEMEKRNPIDDPAGR
jgi:hypothetical protein